MDMTGLPLAKPEKRAKSKRRKHRLEAAVQKLNRAVVMERDGRCAVTRLEGCYQPFGPCAGRSTLAHLAGTRRSQTRGQDPSVRHSPATMVALCAFHHECEEHKGLRLVPLTAAGMNGPITWRLQPPKTLARRA